MSMTDLTSRDLLHFFRPLIERSLVEELGWPDFSISDYITNMLVDFSHVDRVYSLKYSMEASGESFYSPEFTSSTLQDSFPSDEDGAFHQHIGDVTLLTVGLFPDNLCQIKHDQWITNQEVIANYMEVGKEAYSRVAQMKSGHASNDSEIFHKLSENFVLCAYCLDGICEKFQAQQTEVFQETKKFFFR